MRYVEYNLCILLFTLQLCFYLSYYLNATSGMFISNLIIIQQTQSQSFEKTVTRQAYAYHNVCKQRLDASPCEWIQEGQEKGKNRSIPNNGVKYSNQEIYQRDIRQGTCISKEGYKSGEGWEIGTSSPVTGKNHWEISFPVIVEKPHRYKGTGFSFYFR